MHVEKKYNISKSEKPSYKLKKLFVCISEKNHQYAQVQEPTKYSLYGPDEWKLSERAIPSIPGQETVFTHFANTSDYCWYIETPQEPLRCPGSRIYYFQHFGAHQAEISEWFWTKLQCTCQKIRFWIHIDTKIRLWIHFGKTSTNLRLDINWHRNKIQDSYWQHKYHT